MPPKRDYTITLRISFDELEIFRRFAHDWDIDISDLLRTCLSIGLAVLRHIPFARRIHLEDNTLFERPQ